MSTPQKEGVLSAVLIMFSVMSFAVDRYVATNGTGPSPYTSWATAAGNIQDAISVAIANDVVWVSNGVYAVGGVTNYPNGTILTNRVAIYKAITVRSANNDPANTVIKGAWDSLTTTNGPAAVRCVYMTNDASLVGFMLTNGATLTIAGQDHNAGGVFCESANAVISNCVISDNAANSSAGGARYGTLYSCILSGNSAQYGGGVRYGVLYNCTLSANVVTQYGGGAYQSTLYSCILSNNSAYRGGGIYEGTLYNCTVTGNRAFGGDNMNYGGGAQNSILYNCTLSGNSSTFGGGAMQSILSNCTVAGNSVLTSGGGTMFGTQYNCTILSNSVLGSFVGSGGGGGDRGIYYNCRIMGNSARLVGGGAWRTTLYNCTVVGNSAQYGGGTATSCLYNCIVYFNSASTAGSNWYDTRFFTNCCTSPNQDGWAVGNITNDPLFIDKGSGYGTNFVAGNYRLLNNSPCVNTGINQDWMTNAVDLDGRQRIRYGTVDMGAYETIYEGTIYRFGF